jgi:hypothetical protein
MDGGPEVHWTIEFDGFAGLLAYWIGLRWMVANSGMAIPASERWFGEPVEKGSFGVHS